MSAANERDDNVDDRLDDNVNDTADDNLIDDVDVNDDIDGNIAEIEDFLDELETTEGLVGDDETPVVETELDVVTRERNEFKDMALRLQADFENYRKRMANQHSEDVERAAGKLVQSLLPVLDACEAAFAHGADGVEPIWSQLMGVLQARPGGARPGGQAVRSCCRRGRPPRAWRRSRSRRHRGATNRIPVEGQDPPCSDGEGQGLIR